MATLNLKKKGKFQMEGREKGLPCFAKLNWDSQLGKHFSLPSQRNFPISFKPKVAIAQLYWKMQDKTWYSILGLDAEPLFLQDHMLSIYIYNCFIYKYIFLNKKFHSTVLFDPFFEQCTQSEKSTKASWEMVHSQAREKGSNL